MNYLIGITGVARSGKDSLCLAIQELMPSFNWKRFALADPLKKEISSFIFDKFNIDVNNCTNEEKKIIRPLLVGHGEARRQATENQYWWQMCQNKITRCEAKNVIITDIRFCDEHNKDEYHWLRENNGILIHLSRLKRDGTLIGAPNQQEAHYDPKLEMLADFKLCWPTLDCYEKRLSFVKKNLDFDGILDKIKPQIYV